MFSKFTIFILCLCCAANISTSTTTTITTITEEKLCTSMDIRTNSKNRITTNYQFDQLKKCTKIVGYLKLVLLHDVTDYPQFPKLKEITGYVIIFVATNLKDLGEIFPNLMVIRGREQFFGNSLIIHHNNQIQKIGLSNLREIQRGQVEIGKCPNLCYVRTVNWTALGTSLSRYSEIPECEHEECAGDCKGHCWAPGRCQIHDENCHAECLGCSKPDSPKHCTVCRNFKDGDVCVENCPVGKFICEETFTCVTEKECKNMTLPGERWVIDKLCIPMNTCPNKYGLVNTTEEGLTCKPCIGNCTKICSGSSVESIEDIEHLKGCTHIEGHLEFRLTNVYIIQKLSENLGEIREIDGCLKIARSDALNSLDFLKKLVRIGGRDKQKQCNNYTVFIYENANLRTLIDGPNKIATSDEVVIGFHNNPELCLSKIQKFAQNLGITKDTFDAMVKDGKHISPYSNGDKATCADITINVTIVENNPTNITLKWDPYISKDAEVFGYTVFYILSSISNKQINKNMSSDMCNLNGWMSRFVSTSSIQLTKLNPFTFYDYWIKVYQVQLKDKMSGVAGSTEKKTFMTAPDDPSEPLELKLVSYTSTSIDLTWEPPEYYNGNLSHYQIIAYPEKDDPKFLSRRNYCVYPHAMEEVKEIIEQPKSKWINQTENGTCVCELNIFRINNAFCGPSRLGKKFSNEDCNKFMYQVVENDHKKPKVKRYLLEAKSKGRRIPNETLFEIQRPANETSYRLENLKPFTKYIILFSACNADFRGKPSCSAVTFDAARTKENRTADQIDNLDIIIVRNNVVHVSWKDPEKPNGLIVAYNIEYKNVDSSRNVNVPDCITRTQHVNNNLVYKIEDMDPGIYTIRVKPISLFGPGFYSQPRMFKIDSPLNLWVIYLLACIVLIIIILLLILYQWYKRKDILKDIQLITMVNPDYHPVYIEDEWELPREDVELHEEIGQGAFGQVFSGRIKSKNLLCAIKTTNELASPSYKTEFLKEASVMKSFSDAHHVVKLYGVVSKDDPPFVMMELMERGDLKEYLRRSRDSSRSISSPEMYQMAAQIADGMAYLSAKKFVHRDLASRNCMVAADRTVKIGDFGMTRDVYMTDYYRKDTKAILPVRWMAPESLADGIYSSQSDIWSFGIVLWEMVTLAEQPYQGMANDEVLNFVIARGKLARPPESPDVLWEIMQACWKTRPNDRPVFMGLVEKLSPLAGPSFALVSYYHSKEGQDYRLNHRQKEVIAAENFNTAPFRRYSISPEEVEEVDDEDEEDDDYVLCENYESEASHPLNTHRLKKRGITVIPTSSYQNKTP